MANGKYTQIVCKQAVITLTCHLFIPQEADNFKSAGINLMVMGLGDIVDFQFLTSLSQKAWPTMNPAAIQQELEATVTMGENIERNRNSNVDLCVILDNSERVTEQDFNLVKGAVRNLINSLGRISVRSALCFMGWDDGLCFPNRFCKLL